MMMIAERLRGGWFQRLTVIFNVLGLLSFSNLELTTMDIDWSSVSTAVLAMWTESFCAGKGCPEHCRMFTGMPASIRQMPVAPPSHENQKCLQTWPSISWNCLWEPVEKNWTRVWLLALPQEELPEWSAWTHRQNTSEQDDYLKRKTIHWATCTHEQKLSELEKTVL